MTAMAKTMPDMIQDADTESIPEAFAILKTGALDSKSGS